MGTEESNAAVADSGPLIHLTEINCLGLLTIFDALHVPNAVWSETIRQGRVSEADVAGLGNLRRHTLRREPLKRFTVENELLRLHAGERECLYLAQRLGVLVLLTDDLAVREASQRIGLTPVGSLGVIVRAYRMGRLSLSDAQRDIEQLYDVSTLFVTRAIVELAIGQLHTDVRRPHEQG